VIARAFGSPTRLRHRREDLPSSSRNSTDRDRHRHERIPGSGLGLSIVHKACIHGGEVSVEASGKGSTFRVSLRK